MREVATEHGALAVREYGDPPARVVALHGFTLNGAMFRPLAEQLALTVAAPDLPGHGHTRIEPVSVATAVAATATMLEELPAPPLLLGYSQGGRIALQVAIQRPELVSSLVLVSSSPGLSESDRRLRRAADEGLANRIERIGLERFVDEWLSHPAIVTGHIDPTRREADRRIRMENTAAGLAAALRGMGQATVPDCTDLLTALPMPVLFIAGARDNKYVAIARAMADAFGQRPLLVPNTGHNVILERPQVVASAVAELISRQSG